MNEFDVIRRYFTRALPAHSHGAVVLGVGDDCALLAPRPAMQWAVSSDMLVADRHFFADTDPHGLGHKALAVNLSDLAACGARPVAFTLALALPRVDPVWLQGFSDGLLQLADAHDCPLVGGDTTRGPLTLSITVFGEVPPDQALRRSGAQPGDDIWISGTVGDAHLALLALQGRVALTPEALAMARLRLERPTARVALGQALRGIATAALDISDGLLGDLRHLLSASGVGGDIEWRSASTLMAVRSLAPAPALSESLCQQCILAGGDDYELAFTAPATQREAVQQAAQSCAVPVTRIGRISTEAGLRLWDAQGQSLDTASFASFDHFV